MGYPFVPPAARHRGSLRSPVVVSPHYDRRFAERVAANLSAYAAGLLPSDVVDPVTRY